MLYCLPLGKLYAMFIHSVPENTSATPKILASVVVNDFLEVKAFASQVVIPFSKYNHVMTSNILQSTSKLSNVLAICKCILD